MAVLRRSATYAVGLVAVLLIAFGIPGVHASPNPEPGEGQVGEQAFCVDITGRTQGDLGTDGNCGGELPRGLQGTFFDVTIKGGTSSGGRQPSPPQFGKISFRHAKDAQSVKLLRALATNEPLRVTFAFLHPDQLVPYFTISLQNAQVDSVNQYLPDTQTSDTTMSPSVALMEEITLSYTAIQESSGGVTFQHNFKSGGVG
jgi:type VI secretion system Hcp family effector